MMTLDEALVCADNMRTTIDAEGFACAEDFALVCLAAEVRRLRDENERLKVDAERYRWLRDAGATFYTGGPEITDGSDKVHVCEFAMDAAIDAISKAEA